MKVRRELTTVDAAGHAWMVHNPDLSDEFHQDHILQWVADLLERRIKIRCVVDANSEQELCFLNFAHTLRNECICILSRQL